MLQGVLAKPGGAASFDVSNDGSLVYVPDGGDDAGRRSLVWVDRAGQEERIPIAPAGYHMPRLSPNGRYFVVEVREANSSDLVIYDLERGTTSPLTSDPAVDTYPLWSPDGETVVFGSNRGGGPLNIYSRRFDASSPAERLTTSNRRQAPYSWGDDQSLLVFEIVDGDTNLALVTLGAGSEARGLLATEFHELHAVVSPDGRWLTYGSNESGSYHVYVRPFPNVDDGKWQISRLGWPLADMGARRTRAVLPAGQQRRPTNDGSTSE